KTLACSLRAKGTPLTEIIGIFWLAIGRYCRRNQTRPMPAGIGGVADLTPPLFWAGGQLVRAQKTNHPARIPPLRLPVVIIGTISCRNATRLRIDCDPSSVRLGHV